MVVILIIFVILVLPLASILTFHSQWKYYKPIYNQLKVEDFTKASDEHYNQVHSKDGNIIWFANDSTFKLNSFPYISLSNIFILFLDPYSCYWWFKYKKWFETHCDHLKYRKFF